MPSLNRGWQNRWFYLRNDYDSLLDFTGMVVKECPEKWQWGAPVAEQKKLGPLLDGLATLRREGVTTATLVAAFHKRRVLPLAQRALFLYQMMPEASLIGTQMLEELVLVVEISLWITRTVASELAKDYRNVPMHPDRAIFRW
jgi:hypothetical protein